MWSYQSKRNCLREKLLSVAPEVDPHEFVRYLVGKTSGQAIGQAIGQAPRKTVSPQSDPNLKFETSKFEQVRDC